MLWVIRNAQPVFTVSRSIMKNILKKTLCIIVILAVIVGLFNLFYLQPRHVVPILMYHSINYKKDNTLSVKPENFARQMGFLNKHRYKVISLDELVEGIKKEKKFSGKTVVVTFDDGFSDNYTYAFPVLAKYNMPATIFLMTGYIGKKKEYLNWDQVRHMDKSGIDFGGHTRSNVYLPGVEGSGDLWDEISGSKFDIEKELGKNVNYFCYPTGGFNETIKEIVKEAGYKGACTTNRGFDKSNKDVYELNRIKVTNSDTTKPFHFRAKLSGYYNLFRSCRSGE